MDLGEFFEAIEVSMQAEIKKAGFVAHQGDKGDNREAILRKFLSEHLPRRYAVTKGQIVSANGEESHSADIIVYDALNCPVLYAEQTAIVPIEGVYGIIEVKSSLSKSALAEDVDKIRRFKAMYSASLGLIRTREYMALHQGSRPFGIILGLGLASNSLASLSENYGELLELAPISEWANLVCVLGSGIIRHERVDLNLAHRTVLIDTDEMVRLIDTFVKRRRNDEPIDDLLLKRVIENLQERSFGRFYVYLLIMLSSQKLNVPDLGQYLDPEMGPMISRES